MSLKLWRSFDIVVTNEVVLPQFCVVEFSPCWFLVLAWATVAVCVSGEVVLRQSCGVEFSP